MTPVFADTFYWLAIFVPGNAWAGGRPRCGAFGRIPGHHRRGVERIPHRRFRPRRSRQALGLPGLTTNAAAPAALIEDIARPDTAGSNLVRDAAERMLLAGKQPTGRLISPDGVAAVIASLCAPEGRDITGAAIPIDGGWSAM